MARTLETVWSEFQIACVDLGFERVVLEVEGRATALEILATGLDWTFAPTLAVVRNDRWGRTYEAFSENPELVAELGAAAVRGLQGGGGAQAGSFTQM